MDSAAAQHAPCPTCSQGRPEDGICAAARGAAAVTSEWPGSSCERCPLQWTTWGWCCLQTDLLVPAFTRPREVRCLCGSIFFSQGFLRFSSLVETLEKPSRFFGVLPKPFHTHARGTLSVCKHLLCRQCLPHPGLAGSLHADHFRPAGHAGLHGCSPVGDAAARPPQRGAAGGPAGQAGWCALRGSTRAAPQAAAQPLRRAPMCSKGGH